VLSERGREREREMEEETTQWNDVLHKHTPAEHEKAWYETLRVETEPAEPRPEPLSIKIDGITCTAFSQRGKRLKGSDKSDRFHSVWRAERARGLQSGIDDCDFWECSSMYTPQQMLVTPMPNELRHVTATVRAHSGGFPMVPMRVSRDLNVLWLRRCCFDAFSAAFAPGSSATGNAVGAASSMPRLGRAQT
jgi:hypothetical protein